MSQPIPVAVHDRPRRWLLSWLVELDRVDMLAILVALLLLATWAKFWPILLPLAAVIAVLACVLARRRGVVFVGPLFWYELVQLARRGRATWLRCAYSLFLLGGLAIVYVAWFGHGDWLRILSGPQTELDLNALPRLSESFVGALLLIQSAAVFLLTPAYLAGSFTEESDRNTLDLLLTTHLHDHEIVLGKLLSRVADLAAVLLAGLPILSLLSLWGGIEVRVLAALLAVTLLQLLSVGGLAFFCAVYYRRTSYALVMTYATLYFWILSLMSPWPQVSAPFFFAAELHERLAGHSMSIWWRDWPSLRKLFGPDLSTVPDLKETLIVLVGECAIVHGLLAFLFVRKACQLLRDTDNGKRSRSAARRSRERAEVPNRPRPALGDHPWLWKEGYHGSRVFLLVDKRAWVYCLLWIIVGQAFFSFGVSTQSSGGLLGDLNVGSRLLFILMAGSGCLYTAFEAAGSIGRERQQRTLDGLLTLPVEREEIVGAKWLGSILRLRDLAWALAATLVLGLITAALQPLAVLLLLAALAVHLAFLASFGVWLSCVCRRALWANLGMAVTLLLLNVGGWLVPAAFDSPLDVAFCPVRTWWVLGFSWGQLNNALAGSFQPFWERLAIAVGGLVFYAGASWVFWRLACRRLRRE